MAIFFQFLNLVAQAWGIGGGLRHYLFERLQFIVGRLFCLSTKLASSRLARIYRVP